MKINSEQNTTQTKSTNSLDNQAGKEDNSNPFVALLLQMLVPNQNLEPIKNSTANKELFGEEKKANIDLNITNKNLTKDLINNQADNSRNNLIKNTKLITEISNQQKNLDLQKNISKLNDQLNKISEEKNFELPNTLPTINKNLTTDNTKIKNDISKIELSNKDKNKINELKSELKIEQQNKIKDANIKLTTNSPATSIIAGKKPTHSAEKISNPQQNIDSTKVQQNFNQLANTIQHVISTHTGQPPTNNPNTTINYDLKNSDNDKINFENNEQIEPNVILSHNSESIGRGEYKAWIHIHPPELGRILASIKVSGNNAEIFLQATNQSTRNILHSDLPIIRQSLEKADIQVSQIHLGNFSSEQGQGQGQGQNQQQNNQQTEQYFEQNNAPIVKTPNVNKNQTTQAKNPEGKIIDTYA